MARFVWPASPWSPLLSASSLLVFQVQAIIPSFCTWLLGSKPRLSYFTASIANTTPLSYLPIPDSSRFWRIRAVNSLMGASFFPSPFNLFLETGSNCVAQTSVRLTSLVHHSPECLDYRPAPPCLALPVLSAPCFHASVYTAGTKY